MNLLHTLRMGARRIGLDVSRYPNGTPEGRRANLLNYFSVSVVLDVGANEGQFGSEVRRLGYDKTLISFEPLADAFTTLSQRALHDSKWVAIRTAIGATSGTATLNVAENSVSSSLLPILSRHTTAAPNSRYVGKEEVPITTLAEATRPYLKAADCIFLKVDAQGFQREVLTGAVGIWDRIVGLQVELSLTPLYQGEMLFAEGVATLGERGFALMGVDSGFSDPESGRTLQVDALLFREEVFT